MKMRFPGFKILDRYILGKFLSTYFFAIAMIIVIVVVFDYVEKIDDFTELHAPLKSVILDYYLNFIPYFINQFSGLFTFIACIFFTSKMAYQTEIVAMLSGGMSFRRLMWPYFLGALIIASLSLTLNLWLIPISQRQAKNMLEIAGLEIAELVYRADMATNYVLEEYCEGKPVTPTTRMEAEMGSGVTLYVGVEEGYGTTIVPRLVGLPLAQAKGRLWELGLNVGRVDFDEGVNLLNQKDTRVYIQTPGAERSAALGSKVDLRLTLDEKKLARYRAEAEKQAAVAAEERRAEEQQRADSLARTVLEEASAEPAEERPANNNEGFFD